MKGIRRVFREIGKARSRFEGERSICISLYEKGKMTGKFPTDEYMRGRIIAEDALAHLEDIEMAVKEIKP